MQYRYFGKRSHESATMKADIHRLVQAKPGRLKLKKTNITEMGSDGKVSTVGVRMDSSSTPMSARQRHAFCWGK